MTYAIGQIVYGIDLAQLHDNYESHPLANVLNEFFEDESVITTQYSGNGIAPTYIGVELDEIDECTTYNVANLVLMPTDAQKAEFQNKVKLALSQYPELKEILNVAPIVFLTWGSS